MSSNDAGRRIPKRRRTSTAKPSVQLPDLNLPPVEGAGVGLSSSSMAVSHNQASSGVPPPAAGGLRIGARGLPIDVETIDDDVIIYSSSSVPQTRQRSTRTAPVTVIIEDDTETNLVPAGEALDEHVTTLLSLGENRGHVLPRVTNNSPVLNLLDSPEVSVIAPQPPVIQAPPEPKFTCPVCLNELTDATSTNCGHIFCLNCIKSAVRAQKKCPTCRKKLGNNSFHRVYLPSME